MEQDNFKLNIDHPVETQCFASLDKINPCRDAMPGDSGKEEN